MEAGASNGGSLGERLRSLEWRMGQAESNKASAESVGYLRDEMADLKDEVRKLRGAIITGTIGIAGSAVVFALTVLQILAQ